MGDWTPTTLVRVDLAYDRDRASDGHSRYGAYLDQRPDEFRDWPETDTPHSSPVHFACAAWRVATSPVMAPGYAVWRPDLLGITARQEEDKGTLEVNVTVPLSQNEIGHRLPYPWRDWDLDRSWDSDDDYPVRVEPSGKAVLASAVVRLSGADWELPAQTATRGRQLLIEAREAVSVLVDRINTEGGPIVAKLMAGPGRP